MEIIKKVTNKRNSKQNQTYSTIGHDSDSIYNITEHQMVKIGGQRISIVSKCLIHNYGNTQWKA